MPAREAAQGMVDAWAASFDPIGLDLDKTEVGAGCVELLGTRLYGQRLQSGITDRRLHAVRVAISAQPPQPK